jgi:hypothetical protein
LPWSGIERRIIMLKVVYKLVLTACFVFDKSGSSRGQVGLVSAILCCVLAIKRYKSALLFKASVFYATLFYDVFNTWLQFLMAIRNFAGTEITITSLCTFILSGLFFSFSVVILRARKKKQIIENQHPDRFVTPSDYELYFYYLYEIIESEDPHD